MMRGSLDKPRHRKAAQQTLEKSHPKKAREAEGPSFPEGQIPPDHGNEQDDANLNAIFMPSMPSHHKAKSNSTKGHFERRKLTPSRGGGLKSNTETRAEENGEIGNPSMDAMSLPNMLRFLETEETLLTQLQSKMSVELSRLQVEEHVFLHTLKILGQKHASNKKVQCQQETSNGDQDFIDALNEALMENGESVPSNEDKGEGMSEE